MRPSSNYAWQPKKPVSVTGDTSSGHSGVGFGDGSGDRKERVVGRVATWTVVRLDACEENGDAQWVLICVVSGWFPTVPQAELEAWL